jgi:hypothetical protein
VRQRDSPGRGSGAGTARRNQDHKYWLWFCRLTINLIPPGSPEKSSGSGNVVGATYTRVQ